MAKYRLTLNGKINHEIPLQIKRLVFTLVFTLTGLSLFSQAPESFNYQAILRNNDGNVKENEELIIEISIIQGIPAGTAVYTETHDDTTNANGLVNLKIGNGTTSDDFSGINWSGGPYFIQISVGGITLGTSQLLSVPYALHANTADSVTGAISETDPVFDASVAKGITGTDTSNWNNKVDNETDPLFGASVASGITGIDTTNWNNKIDNETDPTVPDGTQTGQMQYWNGTEWVTIARGSTGQVLAFINGKPTWGAIPTAGAGEVQNPITGAIWMDRNLGASRVATSSSDTAAYGSLYQWGRATDGHENRYSDTTNTLAITDTPGHSDFIISSNSPHDWRNPQNDSLWQGLSGANNPCPSGYRLPTEAEWQAERSSWSSNNRAGAFASPLKLPAAGYRDYRDGNITAAGATGYYWSSTMAGTNARNLFFGSSIANVGSYQRAGGSAIRCIKD